MMHLEAIKRRNRKPAPQPTRHETNQARHDASVNRVIREAHTVTPWDTPDPLPEAEAHPR